MFPSQDSVGPQVSSSLPPLFRVRIRSGIFVSVSTPVVIVFCSQESLGKTVVLSRFNVSDGLL